MVAIQILYYAFLVSAWLICLLSSEFEGKKCLTWLLTAGVVTEATIVVSHYVFDYPFGWVYAIYTPLELLFILGYFITISTIPLKRVSIVLLGAYLIYAIYYFVRSDDFLNNNPQILYNLAGLIIIGYSCFYLLNIEPNGTPIQKRSEFWIVAGFLLFYSGNFTIIGLYDTISDDPVLLMRKVRHVLINALNYILYTFIIIGILWNRHKVQKSLLP